MYFSKPFLRTFQVHLAILLFLVLFGLLHVMKPSLIYNKEGGFRPFGVGYKHKTVLPAWVFAIILGMLSYLAISYWILFG